MKEEKFLQDGPVGLSQNAELNSQKEAQNRLYEGLLRSDFDFKNWIGEFCKFENNYDRFLYSEISASIIRDVSDDQVESLQQNLSSITERTFENKSIKQDTQILRSDLKNKKVNISSKGYKLLYKLYDHCNLAIIQRNAYKETKESIQRNVNDFFEEKYSEEYDRNIKPKMDSLEKDITTQLISLVSIFTALAFVMFGSISVLDNLLKNIEAQPVIKTLLVGDLWLICMINIFMLFAKFICFLVGKDKNFNWKWSLIIFNLILLAFLALILFFGKGFYGTFFFL